MITTSVTEWFRFAARARTVTVKLSLGVLGVVETVKMELAFPKGFTLTESGFRLRLTPEVPLISGAMLADNLTVPENPFTLPRPNVVETDDPG
jgi:hypothetical protein